MELIIYTTYATAMRHRPEDLAAWGGLQPAGMGPPRASRPRLGLAQIRCWLGGILVGAGTRIRGMSDTMPGADMVAPPTA